MYRLLLFGFHWKFHGLFISGLVTSCLEHIFKQFTPIDSRTRDKYPKPFNVWMKCCIQQMLALPSKKKTVCVRLLWHFWMLNMRLSAFNTILAMWNRIHYYPLFNFMVFFFLCVCLLWRKCMFAKQKKKQILGDEFKVQTVPSVTMMMNATNLREISDSIIKNIHFHFVSMFGNLAILIGQFWNLLHQINEWSNHKS